MFHPLVVLLVCLCIGNETYAKDIGFQFEIESKTGLSQHSPIWVTLPEELKNTIANQLECVETSELINCQISEDGKQIVFILPNTLAPNESQTQELQYSPKIPLTQVQAIEEQNQISLRLKGTEVLAYQSSIDEPPEGFSKLYFFLVNYFKTTPFNPT